jgi:hypothetical protein
MKELIEIQSKLKSPKARRSLFGNYMFRSCEDILEAVKPLLSKNGCTITINDAIEAIGERVYVKSTATIRNSSGDTESATAFAREPLVKRGFDETQLTGVATSYARKYALNGLLAIDDSVDADAVQKESDAAEKKSKETLARVRTEIGKAKDLNVLGAIYKEYIGMMDEGDKQAATALLSARRKELQGG